MCRLDGLVVVVLAFNWTLDLELLAVIVRADTQCRTVPESVKACSTLILSLMITDEPATREACAGSPARREQSSRSSG